MLKKKDFIEVDYTGRLKDSGEVFDSTSADVAKEANIFSEKAEYAPVIICLGEGHILPGIDEFLVGKDIGEHKLVLSAEHAFGKKRADLIKMIPMSKFADQNIRPVPGLRLNIDGVVGIIKTVSGGRVVVDFNHPLSGRDVEYDLNVRKVVADKAVQVNALLKVLIGIREPKVELKEDKVKIVLPGELPKPLLDELANKIKDLTGVEASFTK